MFTDFFHHLRAHGLKVSLTEWLTLMEALAAGHSRADLGVFYRLARALLIKRETDFDLYDRVFADFFRDLGDGLAIDDEVLAWLENPVLPEISPEELARIDELDLDELRQRFAETLARQNERHDRGSRWVGTGGTSPFGHGGRHPAGVRVGGAGGARSAVQVASERRFRNLRGDRVLDTRQIGLALRRLRVLGRDSGPDELDLDETIDQSARNAGEIELVFRPPRKNRVKLLLLMDVGGSMDPHVELCERLFSATHAAQHFKHFEHRFFHNCVYETLYTDVAQWHGEPTSRVLEQLDRTWSVVFVGDAWMAPWELVRSGGAIDFFHDNLETGLSWLERVRRRCPDSIWLNPEPRRVWKSPTIHLIRQVFPMFELTLDGLTAAVDVLRGIRPNRPLAA